MRFGKLMIVLLSVVPAAACRADDETVNPASWLRSRSNAAPPGCATCPPNLYYPPGTLPGTLPGTSPSPTDPNTQVPPQGAAPGAPNPANGDPTVPFATATAGGGLQGRSLNETLDGDFSGAYYSKTVIVGYTTERIQIGTEKIPHYQDGPTTYTYVPIYKNIVVPETRIVHVPISGEYSGVLVTDNDSPRPMDRVYFGYNYYSGLGASFNQGIGSVGENREMFGFEKTFLDGNASFGMRIPLIQYSGPVGLANQTVGDLNVLFKYAFYNDTQTGNLASVGAIVTAPTSGSGGILADGTPSPRSVLFQPWVGFVRTFDRAYLEGFSDIIVPTNGRDTLLITNSLAAGYWVYQNLDSQILNGIIPTLEVHVHTPLNNRSLEGSVYVPDEVNLTAGLHFRLPRATITAAASVPLVGPRPYNIEAIVNLNFYF